MRVLVAPDKFKGAAGAAAVAAAIAEGLRAGDPTLDVDVRPIADGGDGTLDAALAAGFEARPVRARGPVGEVVDARFGVRARPDGRLTALIELAEICGAARLLPGELRPLDAHTAGVGDAIAAALAAGAHELIVAVGGSASTDAGLGALTALGARVLDAAGAPVPPGARRLGDVDRIDLAGLPAALRDGTVRVRVATDVDAPLLGPGGAVAVFGPQKGIDPALAPAVEAGMRTAAAAIARAAGVEVAEVADRPGGGAAGGISAAFAALLGATIVPGAQFVLDLLDLRAQIAGADLVVIGEGSLDGQTLGGKGPAAVAALAHAAGCRVAAVAGRVEADAAAALGADPVIALIDLAGGRPADSIRGTLDLARQAGRIIAERRRDASSLECQA